MLLTALQLFLLLQYFSHGRGAHETDPISDFSFISAWFILDFILEPEIEALEVFCHNYFYSANNMIQPFFEKRLYFYKASG